jgi:hypothetical protein
VFVGIVAWSVGCFLELPCVSKPKWRSDFILFENMSAWVMKIDNSVFDIVARMKSILKHV